MNGELIPSEYSEACFAAVERYCRSVLDGSRVTGKLERLAVERFTCDLQRTDIEWRYDRVARVFKFFSALKHSKGEWRGRQFVLSDWQAFIVAAVFGFVRPDTGFRVVRICYVQVARKNGKSTFLAGIALYLLAYDDEPGAEVYSAATKKDQARIVFEEAGRMVQQSSRLRDVVKKFRGSLTIESQFATFQPLGADADTLDGLNPSGAVVDELHAHKTGDVWNVLDTGTGARRQSLLVAITTAGSDVESICYEQRDYGIKVLEGSLDDDEFFVYVAELDEDDEWTDPNAWAKGNPNLGISVRLDDLQRRCARAQASPRLQNDFRRKRLNQWTQQAERWIDVADWRACEQQLPALIGKKAWAGLDLSSKLDLTAFVLCIPLEAGAVEPFALVPYFWLPEDRIEEHSKHHRVPYQAWIDMGLVRPTPGNVVDYGVIYDDIVELMGIYQIQECGFDPWAATEITLRLDQTAGLPMVEMRQGYATLSAPAKEFERAIIARTLQHDGNPVMNWMISNVAAAEDPAGNVKPDRAKSRHKIDGVVAAVMALGRAIGADLSENTGGGLEEGLVRLT